MLFRLHLAEKSEATFLMAECSGTEENHFKAYRNLNYIEKSLSTLQWTIRFSTIKKEQAYAVYGKACYSFWTSYKTHKYGL